MTNPFDHLKALKPDNKIIADLSESDVQQLTSACSSNTLSMYGIRPLSLLLDSGLRMSELANLTINAVDMHSGTILVRHGKGRKQRVVHIGTRA
jgi:site-specific recombinase XerD